MSKEAFGLVTYGKGRYQIMAVEKAICLRVARKAVSAAGYADEFATTNGRRFSGTGADRRLLPPSVAHRVDEALCKSIRRYPAAWHKSPVANVAVDRPEADNIILNQGLDYLGAGTAHWGSIGTYCVLGSNNTTPAFTDTGLGSEIVRTNNTLEAGTFITDDVPTRTRTFQRTYDFPAETSGKNYSEIGLSHSATATNNLSTRALIAGGTVTVLPGQQARVVYKVIITLGANAVMTPASSTGWTAGLQGTSAYCTFDGLPTYVSAGTSLVAGLYLLTTSTIPPFGTGFYLGGEQGYPSSSGLHSYTVGSYKRLRTSSFGLSDAVGTWRSIVVWGSGALSQTAWCFVFDNAQTKDTLHTLTITWSMSYARS